MAIGRPIQLTGNVASKVIRVLATEGQTVFTVTGGYRINQIGVFRNGVRLSNNSDFTALDGVTVTLVNAAPINDEVLFQIQDDFRVADAIVGAASSQTIHGDLVVNGDLFYNGNSNSGILTSLDGQDGSGLTGIVTSITAGSNINVSGSTGSVTVSGASTISVTTINVSGNASVTGVITSSEYDGYFYLDSNLFS